MLNEMSKDRLMVTALMNTAPVFIVALDRQGNILLMNDHMLRSLGYNRSEELLGKDYLSVIVPPEERDRVRTWFQSAFGAEMRLRNETLVSLRKVAGRPIEWHLRVVREETDPNEFALAVGLDMTPREARQGEADVGVDGQGSTPGPTRLIPPALRQAEAFARIITGNESLQGLFRYANAIGSTALPVLIIGETGVGKELFARALHEVSGRQGLFVPINAAGLDDSLFSDTLFGHVRGAFTGADRDHPGLVQRAAGGTLFLDEIGDLSLESQVKLLRLLQEREYYALGAGKPSASDARFLFATCHDLFGRVREGLFRQDLYYRLQSHSLTIPPLRERPGDIPLLVDHFLRQAATFLDRRVPTVPREVIGILQAYQFPGNVRELEGMVYDALVSTPGDTLSPDHFNRRIAQAGTWPATRPSEGAAFPPQGTRAPSLPPGGPQAVQRGLPTLRECSDKLIEEAIRSAQGNKTRAAAILGISRQALCNRLRRRKRGS
jgi:PAS domain S-box-containing protein